MTDDRDLHIEQLSGGAVDAFVAVLAASDAALLSGLDCLAMAERLARAEKACAPPVFASPLGSRIVGPMARWVSPRVRSGPPG